MMRARRALLALAGSVGLHLAAASAILPVLAARPPPQQTGVQSELALSTVQIRRNKAQEKAPQPDAADRLNTSGARIGSGGIARTRAAAKSTQGARAPAKPIAGARAAAQALDGARAKAKSVAGAQTATQGVLGRRASAQMVKGRRAVAPAVAGARTGAQALAAPRTRAQAVASAPAVAQAATGTRTSARAPATPRTPALAGTGTRQVAAAMPETALAVLAVGGAAARPVQASAAAPPASISSVSARSAPLDPAAPRMTGTAIASPKAQSVPPAAPVIAAGLAWSGSEKLALDAQSVATLAAFLQPGEAQGQQLRDAMAGIMAAPPCARIHTVFDPETGALDLRGHVPDAAARAPLIASLRAQIGGGLPVRDLLRILPAPQCGVLDAVAALGLPQSDEQLTDSDLVGEHAQVREYAFSEGDRLVVDLTAPEYPAYVYVDYFDAAGQVIHLRPNAQSALALMPPDAVFSVGRGSDMDLRIAAPFGQDIAVAFAASVPLYEGVRPLVEPAGPYLETMRDLIAEQRAAHLGFRGEWVYLFVATHPAGGDAGSAD